MTAMCCQAIAMHYQGFYNSLELSRYLQYPCTVEVFVMAPGYYARLKGIISFNASAAPLPRSGF